jgi:hypothetical protein
MAESVICGHHLGGLGCTENGCRPAVIVGADLSYDVGCSASGQRGCGTVSVSDSDCGGVMSSGYDGVAVSDSGFVGE